MKPRGPMRKMAAPAAAPMMLLLLLLTAGAAVNVAVAWGFAWWSCDGHQIGNGPEEEWPETVPSGWEAGDTLGFRGTGIHYRIALTIIEHEDIRIETGMGKMSALKAGWPCLSLY